MTLEEKVRRLVTFDYQGGVNGTCYMCPYASPPLRKDGSVAPPEEISNDPTEAYFRCSLPGRNDALEWGEYAVCSIEEWIKGAILPAIEELRAQSQEAIDAANAQALHLAEIAQKSDKLNTALFKRINLLKAELVKMYELKALNEELRPDAERYRWLRANPITFSDGRYVMWQADELDTTIDNARTA